MTPAPPQRPPQGAATIPARTQSQPPAATVEAVQNLLAMHCSRALMARDAADHVHVESVYVLQTAANMLRGVTGVEAVVGLIGAHLERIKRVDESAAKAEAAEIVARQTVEKK